MNLKSLIKDTPDFPKPGVLFRDISPLLKDPAALAFVSDEFGKLLQLEKIDLIAGIESRGFILGMLLAARHGKGFLPIRKAGKLPPPVIARSYDLEYGRATLELNPGQGRVLIIDDVLATGGTLKASIQLCQEAGYEVIDVAVLINLLFLNDMKFGGRQIPSLIQY